MASFTFSRLSSVITDGSHNQTSGLRIVNWSSVSEVGN
jgi:hypothetical protein